MGQVDVSRITILLVVLTAVALTACGGSSKATTTRTKTTKPGTTTTPGTSAPTEVRDLRYCEVIPSVTKGSTTYTYVYNTLGFNYCPPGKWNKLTEAEVNQEYGSQSAKLNGPRHWVMDAISGSGSSASGKTFTFGGIETGLRGTLTTPAGQPTVGSQYYVVNKVQRTTTWVYKAGKPIFELTDPKGDVYVMQSYAQIIDKTLTYKQLPSLGSKLQLPQGWKYSTETPKQELKLVANGVAYVVNDNFADSYQRR